MPRPSKGARLWLRPASYFPDGRLRENAGWIIKDGSRAIRLGCGASEIGEAQDRFGRYLAQKYAPARQERGLSDIPVADVLNIYLDDVIASQAQPAGAIGRVERLLEFFGAAALDEINGAKCRAYVAFRAGKGRANKGAGGGARRDLQDLAAAIGHHKREGLHRSEVKVVLPPQGKARTRWLSRGEAAKLLKICWRAREVQDGQATQKRPLRHLCRFLLLGLYTGSRPGAILNAAWLPGPGLSFVDLDAGIFHRHADGGVETAKRQPDVRIAPRLAAHLRRWRRLDAAATPPGVFVVSFHGQKVLSVKTALIRATKLAGLDHVTAYTLRHSCASWLVAKGLPTRKIADFLGTGEAMIERHYGHLAPDYQNDAAEAIGRK